MDSILPVISAIFALPSEVLPDGQWTQSDSWLSHLANSALELAGEAGVGRTEAYETAVLWIALTLARGRDAGASCRACRLLTPGA
jgi:hypothetical protein